MLGRLAMRRRAPAPPAAAAVPAGMRVYAIGDVHGRRDLLDALLGLVEADDAARTPAETHVLLLGDLIDRGPDSRAVIERLLDPPRFARFHAIMGNHEEMLLRLIDAPSPEGLAHFLRYGGRETFESYGVPQRALDFADEHPPERFTAAIPAAHQEFVRAMGDAIQVGDYLFVHAGIRPEVALEDQEPADIRWIRAPFLGSRADHGAVIVHGHTIASAPVVRPNRIGIDTGAYRSGVLTALGVEGGERWFLATGEAAERPVNVL